VPRIAVSALGRDRPGIVTGVTAVLLEHGLNLADSQMGILSGRFSMTLLVEASRDGDAALDMDALRRDLRAVGEDLRLDAIFATPVPESGDAGASPGAGPSLMVSVYGADHPGIVHAVARELSYRGVNIVDLQTRLAAGQAGGPALYAMFIEVVLPGAMAEAELAEALQRIGGEQHVEISVRVLEEDVL
jgi:glycine cleavage system transcriptional repressor